MLFGEATHEHMGSHHQKLIFKSNWSLKTTDECVAYPLFGSLPEPVKSKPVNRKAIPSTIDIKDGLLLGKIENFLRPKFCKALIEAVEAKKVPIYKNFLSGESIVCEPIKKGSSYEHMSLVELRAIAKQNNTSTAGTKEEIIARLTAITLEVGAKRQNPTNEPQKTKKKSKKKKKQILEEDCPLADLGDKYEPSYRSGKRVVLLDKDFTKKIWSKLQDKLEILLNNERIEKHPRGFDILPTSDWKISGLNECVRIMLYNEADKFGIHRDAQYCPNPDQRSVFTILLYLNEDYEGGETEFYFPKENKLKNKVSDFTVNEEIQELGGIDNFQKITVKGATGDAVIMSQPILHAGAEIKKGKKWVMKLDIVSKRDSNRKCNVCGFYKGFDQSNDPYRAQGCYCGNFNVIKNERKAFLRCIDYFREAQFSELNGNAVEANELYEKALSIRYSFPAAIKNEETVQQNKDPYYVTKIPLEVWALIFDYCGEGGVTTLAKAFPNRLHFLRADWLRKHYQHVQESSPNQTSDLPDFVPLVIERHGIFTKFSYKRAFFEGNTEGCLRVSALYCFSMLGSTGILSALPTREPKVKKSGKHAYPWQKKQEPPELYPVRYDSENNTICCVPLLNLLRDVFENKSSYGAIYVVKKRKSGNLASAWERSVDRHYMLHRHNAEFTGFDGPQVFQSHNLNFNVQANMSKKSRDNDVEIRDVCLEELQAGLREGRMLDTTEFDHYPVDLLARVEHSKFKNVVGGDTYARHVDAAKYTDCSCGLGDGEDILRLTWYPFNHLVFDFEGNRMEVTEMNAADNCCIFLQHLRKQYSPMVANILSDPKITVKQTSEGAIHKIYKVDITSVLDAGTGFNHASCNCEVPRAEISGRFYVNKNAHLDHIHIYARSDGEETTLSVLYGGIAAL